MPINFELNKEGGYYIVSYIGQLTDADMINGWKEIFKQPNFSLELNELTDVSEIDASKLTAIGMRDFAKFINSNRWDKKSGIRKVAVYAPNNLSFGLARIYEGYTDENTEIMEVFKNLDDAKKYLLNNINE